MTRKLETALGIGGGLALGLSGLGLGLPFLLSGQYSFVRIASVVILFCGIGSMIYGCCMFAVGKGYHWLIGLLCSVLGLPGFIALVCLRDKNRNLLPPARRGFDVIPATPSREPV